MLWLTFSIVCESPWRLVLSLSPFLQESKLLSPLRQLCPRPLGPSGEMVKNPQSPRTSRSGLRLHEGQCFHFLFCLRRACDHRCQYPSRTSAPDVHVRRGTGCNGGGASDTDRPSAALVARFQTAGREPTLLCAPRAPSRDLPDGTFWRENPRRLRLAS